MVGKEGEITVPADRAEEYMPIYGFSFALMSGGEARDHRQHRALRKGECGEDTCAPGLHLEGGVKLLKITGPAARKAACEAVMSAPDGWMVRVSLPTRSLEQNALLHALLSEISESTPWAGQLRDLETWKRLLTCAWMRATGQGVEMLPALDGHGFDVLYRRTSQLDVAEMTELIEYVQCWHVTQQADKAAA